MLAESVPAQGTLEVKDLFSNSDAGADPWYLASARPAHKGSQRARQNCDDLWRDFEPFASGHFLAEFPYRYHQRWFEMYLTVALLRAGIQLECPETGAPDIRAVIDGRIVWIEATAPTGGAESNPDRVVETRPTDPSQESVAYRVPTENVILRVSGALRDKSIKIREYRDESIIGPDDCALIAINICGIPHGFYDPVKYALGATYGVGNQYVTIDPTTHQTVDSGWQYRAAIPRSSGSPVDVSPFLRPGLEHVGGAIVGSLNSANCDHPIGRDFIQLPNQFATRPYPQGRIKMGREWVLTDAGDGTTYNGAVTEHT
jgi:hypothetical protein